MSRDISTFLRLRRDLFDPHLVADLLGRRQGFGLVFGRQERAPVRFLEYADDVGCGGLVGYLFL
ncbi:hypothetical protein EN935_26660 [Mesorhizobium sp. M7D.F.Ca.US.004.03.1.1]|jgi:hypothetical protein|uniref:hypothetical protein n=1 Tax=Mesorhizobium sp. M7D.F.Ca.US.004.03.1.1 TaxID=2496702 RepID=UPI000FCB9590|nr:hypothetical protein [Mesorhizobium sp. M7D.F.Ca.US.004.03.1.1]RVA24122.1 hypothetical protein EN935_26660 [Mesorhizobium sp. M7D.F.Ca.US.004.03.1.1]